MQSHSPCNFTLKQLPQVVEGLLPKLCLLTLCNARIPGTSSKFASFSQPIFTGIPAQKSEIRQQTSQILLCLYFCPLLFSIISYLEPETVPTATSCLPPYLSSWEGGFVALLLPSLGLSQNGSLPENLFYWGEERQLEFLRDLPLFMFSGAC